MNRTLLILSLFAFSLPACSGGEGDGGGGGGGGGDGGGGGGGQPASGAWDYAEFTPVSNTCNTDLVAGQPSGGFGLLNNGDNTFTVTPGDGTDPFDCTLNGTSYVCDSTNLLEEDINGALVVGIGSVAGNFPTSTTVTGTRTLDISCTGASCAVLENATGASFPCQLQVSFTGSLTTAL